MKEKCDAGADVVITQMFFDPLVYGHFVKDCRAAGITAHVIPGIMCINAFGGFQVNHFTLDISACLKMSASIAVMLVLASASLVVAFVTVALALAS